MYVCNVHSKHNYICVPVHLIVKYICVVTLLLYFIVCMHNGIIYEEGSQIQPDCSTWCVCTNGNFQCQPQACIIDGGATCYASGDPHYYTFDQRYFDFQGSCEYVLTQSCNFAEFAVIVTNGAHNSRVSCTDAVKVVIPSENLNISLGRGGGGTVTINDMLQPNNGDEIILRSGQVDVVRVGGCPSVVLRTSGVRVSWDGLYRVEVTVSTQWSGRLCGLCGNYNGDPNDDFLTPNGILETSANEFGLSWVLNNGTHDNCGGTIPDQCPAALLAEAQERCSVLRGGNFDECNDNVDPTIFIESCVFDYCHSDQANRENFFFNSLAFYASACGNNGETLPPVWRNESG